MTKSDLVAEALASIQADHDWAHITLTEEIERLRARLSPSAYIDGLTAEIEQWRGALEQISTKGDKDSELGEFVKSCETFGEFDGESPDSAFYEGEQSGRFEMGKIARAALKNKGVPKRDST